MDIIKQDSNNKPWERQRYWKKQPNTPTYDRIRYMIMNYDRLRDKALFALAYLTGCRISEIVPKKYLYRNVYAKDEFGNLKYNKQKSPIIKDRVKIQHDYPGIVKSNIELKDVRGVECLVIYTQNRKSKKYPTKTMPCPIEKERELCNIVLNYIKNLRDQDSLFNISVTWAEQIISKSGLNPHFLRDIRATHLTEKYRFSEFDLQKWMGWTDSRPSAVYVRKEWGSIVENFK